MGGPREAPVPRDRASGRHPPGADAAAAATATSPADRDVDCAGRQWCEVSERVAIQLDDVVATAGTPVDQAHVHASAVATDVDDPVPPIADPELGSGGGIEPARIVAMADADSGLTVPGRRATGRMPGRAPRRLPRHLGRFRLAAAGRRLLRRRAPRERLRRGREVLDRLEGIELPRSRFRDRFERGAGPQRDRMEIGGRQRPGLGGRSGGGTGRKQERDDDPEKREGTRPAAGQDVAPAAIAPGRQRSVLVMLRVMVAATASQRSRQRA